MDHHCAPDAPHIEVSPHVVLSAIRYGLGRSLVNGDSCELIRAHWEHLHHNGWGETILEDVHRVMDSTTFTDVFEDARATIDFIRRQGIR